MSSRNVSQIYEDLKKAEIPIDHYESDLYAKVSLESQKIIDNYEWKANVTIFRSNIDHERWFDIPFAWVG